MNSKYYKLYSRNKSSSVARPSRKFNQYVQWLDNTEEISVIAGAPWGHIYGACVSKKLRDFLESCALFDTLIFDQLIVFYRGNRSKYYKPRPQIINTMNREKSYYLGFEKTDHTKKEVIRIPLAEFKAYKQKIGLTTYAEIKNHPNKYELVHVRDENVHIPKIWASGQSANGVSNTIIIEESIKERIEKEDFEDVLFQPYTSV